MPVSLDGLEPDCRTRFLRLFDDCERNGTPMRPFYVERSPWAQAKLWRQSRSRLEVQHGIRWLRAAGAAWLASLVEEVGPQFGRWATNAVPGNSWHQWRNAVDAYAEVDGRISWDTVPGKVGGPGDYYYRFYAERAAELGLTPLGPRIGDWCHVQAPPEMAPADRMTWLAIDAEMRRRFGR